MIVKTEPSAECTGGRREGQDELGDPDERRIQEVELLVVEDNLGADDIDRQKQDRADGSVGKDEMGEVDVGRVAKENINLVYLLSTGCDARRVRARLTALPWPAGTATLISPPERFHSVPPISLDTMFANWAR